MNHAGAGRWRAYSAGSTPTGTVNPFALDTLAAHAIPLNPADMRSKSWDEFCDPSAPCMDVVVTVCDNAGSETCPAWPVRDGNPPQKLHWSFPDPAAAQGPEEDKRAAFEAVFSSIRTRIDAFLWSSR